MYRTITGILTQLNKFRRRWEQATILLWYQSFCDTHDSVTPMPLWHSWLCDTHDSVTPMPLWHPCLCDTHDSVTPMTLWHPWLCDTHATVTPMTLWHPCLCDTHASSDTHVYVLEYSFFPLITFKLKNKQSAKNGYFFFKKTTRMASPITFESR